MSDEDTPRHRGCGTMAVHRRLLDSDPDYARRLERIEEMAFRARQGMMVQRPGCTQIPVVVHVVWKTAAQNISQDQIDSQIRVLNEDFRKKNADIGSVPAAFAPLAGDARLQFVLASRDPQGNPHSGVVRVQTTKAGFGHDDAMKRAADGGSDAWPRDSYLNIWVCQLTGGLLGYAQFPGGPADTDGVVITHTAFGTTGTAAAPFDKGRTATHEIGHWLNLRHIWGDDGTGCSGSDFVDDTPNQGGPNGGKPSFPHVSCNNGPNGDMFMNYMDYVDDDAMMMFTQGQITRMQACLDGPRSAIGSSVSCGGITKVPGKDIGKDVIKELPKEQHKDSPKDSPKDWIKDGPKDGIKDFVKDGVKDSPKDGVKDIPKDGIKDNPKDWLKDRPKDLPKDGPKDFVKDRPKDLAKDSPFDQPKNIVLDNPKGLVGDKNVFEPGPDPKSALEPPSGVPGIPSTIPQPLPGPAAGPQAMPFVLGTGAEAGGGQQRPAPMLTHYAQILQHYAALHQRGLLDDQGLTAWQQAYEDYRALGGQ